MRVTIALKNVFRLLATTLVAILLVFSSGFSAHAQKNTSQNITMSPASTLISLKPGQSVEKKFQILNSGGDTYSVITKASPYHVEGLDYNPQFTQLPGTTDTTSWIKIMNSSVSVAAQKSIDINYTVSVPQGTAPGGYYAVLFAETRPVEPTEASGVVPRNRVGNILYITVEGPVKMSGDVSVEKVGGFRYQPSIPVGFKVSNTGGVHFQTTVEVSIKSFTGKELYKSTVERYVLPQTQRAIPINWAPNSPIGIYTVHRTAIVAQTNRNIPDETFVYVQPWIIIFAIVLLGSIVLFFSSRASNRRKNSSEKQSKK